MGYESVIKAVPEGLVWSYRAIVRNGHVEHIWTLVGDRGGIHVSAWRCSGTPSFGREWLGGIEGHSPTPHDYSGEKPDHEHCWVIDKPCWHDGSSLQFSEQIAPYLPVEGEDMSEREHLDVLHVMRSRYGSWLPELSTPTPETHDAE